MDERVPRRHRNHKAGLSLRKIQSAITNGSKVLLGVDHRSPWMRRLQDLINHHAMDLGGPDAISHAETLLIRHAAVLELQLEMMSAGWGQNQGEASPRALETYQRTTNTLRRLLETLGLERRAKDITPTVDEYEAIVRAHEANGEKADE
jgi:hypothetical protein